MTEARHILEQVQEHMEAQEVRIKTLEQQLADLKDRAIQDLREGNDEIMRLRAEIARLKGE